MDGSTTLKTLQKFCKTENITGYSGLRKVELLNHLFRKNKPECSDIVRYYLNAVSAQELVNYYLFLKDCDFKIILSHKLESLSVADWNKISGNRHMTMDFIIRFQNHLNWKILSSNTCLTEDTIFRFQDRVEFHELSKRTNIPENVIRLFFQKMELKTLCKTNTFSEAFMRDFLLQLCPHALAKHQKLSEDFLRANLYVMLGQKCRKTFWELIAKHQVLGEDFISDHIFDLPWNIVCEYQVLSLRLLLELKEVAEYYMEENNFWNLISRYQNLPIQFLHEFKDKINWTRVVVSKTLSEEVVLTFKDRLDSGLLKRFQKLSPEFIETHLTPYKKATTAVMCSVCLEVVESGIETNPCKHLFCKPCIDRCLELQPNCPYCRHVL